MKKLLLGAALLIGAICTATACGTDHPSDVSTETAADTSAGSWAPDKAINIIVPYEAGGNSDIPTRIFAKHMAKYTDVEINITNITGAGGRTGAKEAMAADADGYTYLLQSAGFVMQHALGIADFSYEDFEPVGYMLDSSLALVVSKDSPYETLDDLIAAAAENPDTIKFGTVTGTLPLFAALYLESQNDIVFNKVDLGTGAKAPELLSNRIDCYADGFGAVKQYVDSGDFRCMVVYSDELIPGYDNVPSLGSLEYENFGYLKQNFGLWAPKGTDEAAAAYVNELIRQAAADPECIAELQNLSYAPMSTTVDEYTEIMKTIYAEFGERARDIVQ